MIRWGRGWRRFRTASRGGWVGAALLAWCMPPCGADEPPVAPEIIRIAPGDSAVLELPPLKVRPATDAVAEAVASPREIPKSKPAQLGPKAVPIGLDAVLCLARDQNGQVRLAREKLAEAFAEQDLAAKRWLPEISVGIGYWRHEGGIQDFDGNLLRSSYGSVFAGLEVRNRLDIRDAIFQRLDAARKVWQQQGELSKFTSEQLLDAATTYIDLLAARSAEAIALEAEAKLSRLLVQADSLEKVDPGVRVEVARVEAELGAQRMLTRRLREGASAAAAKLIYLLGLDPASELVLLERQMVAIRLVDVRQSNEALVETALRNGPGVQELQAILGLLEESRAKGDSPLHWLPTLEVRMADGGFAAGPGSRLDWESRWDVGVQARWNLTEFITGRERKRLADLKIQQAHLSYQDLRAKLTLGVYEAAEAIRSTEDQMNLAVRQIAHAEESYNLSDLRLRENIKGRSPSEVLLATRALLGARLGYLHALRDHDKAQLRLFVFTGAACAPTASR